MQHIDAVQWTGDNFEEVHDWAKKCDLDLYVRGYGKHSGVNYMFLGIVGDRDAEWGLAETEYAVVDASRELAIVTEREFTERYSGRPS